MYNKYETNCFVLSSISEKEANKSYILFSENLGLIYAKAQGVSKPSSKLRGNLEPISKAKLSLVKGKEVWRIVGAEESVSLWQKLKNKREELFFVSRIIGLIRRLVISEEKHDDVFKVLKESFDFALNNRNVENIFPTELVAVSRILHSLGYFSLKKENNPFFQCSLSEIKIEDVLKNKRNLILDINQAIKESHL